MTGFYKIWARRDSNPRPKDYESSALPLRHRPLLKYGVLLLSCFVMPVPCVSDTTYLSKNLTFSHLFLGRVPQAIIDNSIYSIYQVNIKKSTVFLYLLHYHDFLKSFIKQISYKRMIFFLKNKEFFNSSDIIKGRTVYIV